MSQDVGEGPDWNDPGQFAPAYSPRFRDQLQLIDHSTEVRMSITVCVVCGDTAEKAYPVGSFDEFKCAS